VNCINKNWDVDDQKEKMIIYEIENDAFVVYDKKGTHREDSSFDLAKKNQFMEMDVYLADGLPHFKFNTNDGKSIWHFIIDYGEKIIFSGYSGECTEVVNIERNSEESDFEEIQ